MRCIIPKDGFVIKDDKAILSNECNLGRQPGETFLFHNPFSNKCQDSQKIFSNCLQIDYLKVDSCKKCIHDLMDPNNNCECKFGTFFDEVLKQCTYCSPQCESCKGQKNFCLTCKERDSQPPKCNCPYQNQYKDNNYSCLLCSPQCESCLESPENCITCSYGRINPPFCNCDKKYYQNIDSDLLKNECRPIICKHNCEKCEFSSDNCISCKGNRINPPLCECEDGYYEDPIQQLTNCSKCESQFYYDFKLKRCQKCYDLCETCNGPKDTDCKRCKGSLQLNDYNQCVCSSGSEPVRNNPDVCYNYLNIIHYIHLELNEYKIIIEFEYEIDFLVDIISELGIDNIIKFTISEIPQEFYSISVFDIPKSSQLILSIQIKKSFQSTFGFILFKETNIFKNEQQKLILDSIYKRVPIQFQLGPYMFVIQKNTKDVMNAIQSLTPTNESIMNILKNLQFIFYVINSSQPTAMFLLVNVQIPINFYSFLSLFGSFVYKYMPEYQQNNQQQKFSAFGKDINQYVKSSSSILFDRYGFRDSFLANCEVIFYKYFAIIVLIIIVSGIKEIQYPKVIMSQENNIQRYQSIIDYLIVKISQENEINLLMVILSISIQIYNNDIDSNWFNRWSFYATSFVGLVFFVSIFKLYLKYNSRQFFKFQKIFDPYFERLKEERFSFNWYIKNYHFIFLAKKIFLVFFIFILVEYPLVVCCIGAILNISTAILTLYLRPYKFLIQTLVKGIGDILLFLSWVFMIIFYKFSQDHIGQTIISESDVETFILYGFIAILFLLIFNMSFFILFLFESIILPIYNSLLKNKKHLLVYQKKKQNHKNNLISIEDEIQSNKNLDVYLEFQNTDKDSKKLLIS